MTYRTILLHIDEDAALPARQALAERLAADFGAHLVGLHVASPPIVPAAYGEVATYIGPEVMEAQRAAAKERAARLEAGFDASCRAADITGEWCFEEADPLETVARRARYADLSIVGQIQAEGIEAILEQLPEHAVLGSGGPVLIVPSGFDASSFGRRLLVAWNGSREAARAVRDAMPLLMQAESVTVLEIDPEDGRGTGADLVPVLARHEVRSDSHHMVSGGLAAGDCLLSMVADSGCDCLVMGAYGHSRLREIVLGGVTRTVLDQMTVPVLTSA